VGVSFPLWIIIIIKIIIIIITTVLIMFIIIIIITLFTSSICDVFDPGAAHKSKICKKHPKNNKNKTKQKTPTASKAWPS